MESTSSATSMPWVSAIFGSSSSMVPVRELAQRAAFLHTPVFIYGPTGSGKEVLARYIHLNSPRKSSLFLTVNCATTAELLETELFGFVEGAFPGASATNRGLLELADEGTLLLDDISELDLRLQEKLLTVLQDGTFTAIGAAQPRRTRVRIIATANTTLEGKVDKGFRRDLFERLSSIRICMPPLRERIEDLPAIARYMLTQFANMLGNPFRPLPPAAMHRLMRYEWPGNIRELENILFQYTLTKASLAPLRRLALQSDQPRSTRGSAALAESEPLRSQKTMSSGAAGNSINRLPNGGGERP